MNVPIRERLGANVDSELLAALRDLAAREGREIDGLIDEALADLIEKRRRYGREAACDGGLPEEP